MSIARTLRNAVRFGRRHGVAELARRTMQVLGSAGPVVPRPIDLSHQYRVIFPEVSSLSEGGPAEHGLTVNWFIPDVGPGGGGHLNIFRFVKMLEEQGVECRIVALGNVYPDLDPAELSENIAKWYMPLKARTHVGLRSVPPATISMATSWETAYAVEAFEATVHKCYFVQDFEPSFFPAGAESAFAEATYSFGFTGITAGNWLADKLSAEYGMRTHALGFSFDRTLYRPREIRSSSGRQKRILFYARPSTARRGFELGMLALRQVVYRIPDVMPVLVGGSLAAYDIPFPHVDADVVSLEKLGDLYAECDVALVLSFTNLSLLPLELMACGVPVVSNRAPCTEWLLNDDNARLTAPTVAAVADGLCAVLEQPLEAERLRQGGLATAEATSWDLEGHKLGMILRTLGRDQLGARSTQTVDS